jgi:regulator of RNase E activity RraA
MTEAEKISYLKRIDSGVVTDAMGLLGLEGWTDGIFPTNKDYKIAGKAFTGLFTAPVSGDEKTYSPYDVIEMCGRGDVLVLAGAPKGRIFGGNLALKAKNQGLEGIVLDGRTRDVSEIENCLPIFCRGPINYPTDNKYKLTQVNVVVNCDGAMIKPGDIILGDRDGIIVIPGERLDDVIYQCEHVEAVEAKMQAALKNKASAAEAKAVIKAKKIPRK